MQLCLFSARVGFSPLLVEMIKVLSAICTLIWRINSYVSHQEKSINQMDEKTTTSKIVCFVLKIASPFDSFWLKAISSLKKKLRSVTFKKSQKNYKKNQFLFFPNISPSWDDNKNKRAKVSSCFKGTRAFAGEYLAQFSEEIEGRVTIKMSQEFSRTESRILGGLTQFQELFWSPQGQAPSGTVSGTSCNND